MKKTKGELEVAISEGSYADRIAQVSTNKENYCGENWDDALNIACEVDAVIKGLKKTIRHLGAIILAYKQIN